MGRAVAQAQAQKQSLITAQESLSVVRSLLRVSVFHVSYLRGLFDEDAFKRVDMDNLQGMTMQMLMPVTEETQRLVDWVDKGVTEALEKKYLKTLVFGFSKDNQGTALLEEYKFSFGYDNNGVVSMKLNTETVAKGRVGGMDYKSVKFQVIKLMRMVVQICQTLSAVPDDRYIFMKLVYHESTPADYEPPGFVSAKPQPAHFEKQPFSMAVGSVETGFHSVGLQVLSNLDAGAVEDDEQSRQESCMPDASMMDADEKLDQGDIGPELADKGSAGDGNGQAPAGSSPGVLPPALESQYNALYDFCKCRKQVEVTDIMEAFVDVRQASLDRHLVPHLLRQGVLRATGCRDRYEVVEGPEEMDVQPSQPRHALLPAPPPAPTSLGENDPFAFTPVSPEAKVAGEEADKQGKGKRQRAQTTVEGRRAAQSVADGAPPSPTSEAAHHMESLSVKGREMKLGQRSMPEAQGVPAKEQLQSGRSGRGGWRTKASCRAPKHGAPSSVDPHLASTSHEGSAGKSDSVAKGRAVQGKRRSAPKPWRPAAARTVEDGASVAASAGASKDASSGGQGAGMGMGMGEHTDVQPEPSEPANDQRWFASQQSLQGPPQRAKIKISVVEQPIRQSKRIRRQAP